MYNIKPMDLAGLPFYVIVVERDQDPMAILQSKREPEGPMVWETYLRNATRESTEAQAQRLTGTGTYGQAVIAECKIIAPKLLT